MIAQDSASLGAYQGAVDAARAELREERVLERLWAGDRRALLDGGRRVIRFHLREDVVAGLERLAGTRRKGESGKA